MYRKAHWIFAHFKRRTNNYPRRPGVPRTDESYNGPSRATYDDAGADACIKYLADYAVKLVVMEATGGLEI